MGRPGKPKRREKGRKRPRRAPVGKGGRPGDSRPRRASAGARRVPSWAALGLLVMVGAGIGLGIIVAFQWFRGSGGPPGPAPRPAVLESESILAEAQRHVEAERYDQARAVMEPYVRKNPLDAVVRPRLAEVYLKLGKLDLAEAAAGKAVRFAPGAARALWAKGLVCQAGGDRDGAMGFFRQAAESSSADAEIWGKYGLVLRAEGRADQAADYLHRAYDAGRRTVPILTALGLLRMGANRYAQAASYFGDALRLVPNDVDVRLSTAEAWKLAGKFDQAEAVLKDAPECREAQGRILMALGDVRVLRKCHEEAAEAFALAAGYQAMRPEAALRAARSYFFAKRFALAMKYIDIAWDYRPGHPEVAQWREWIEDARFVRPEEAGPGEP